MNHSKISANQARNAVIDGAQSVLVKVGTRVLTDSEGKLDRYRIEVLSAQLCRIADSGRQVVLVSSGAVGAGVGKLGLDQRPTGLAQLQAIAAIGQTDLIQAYESSFSAMGRHAAQVLLTASDLRRRSGYLHVRNALTQIHAFGAIAIINENDSVAVSELMTTFGDNDQLAAQVAGLLTDALLITYGDSIVREGEAPLRTLDRFAREHLEGVVRTIHILPFSQTGFSTAMVRPETQL